MSSVWSLIICSLVLISLLLCRNVWTMACHREEQFVKVEGTLQAINPIKTTTATAEVFCSTECIDFPGCNSFAYLTATDTNNCQLSASIDGESTTAVSVSYKKVPAKSIAGCASSPCLNGGTCKDLCYEPYYACHCPSDKQGKNCEWDLACVTEDWSTLFDYPGTYECSGTKNYMDGFKRSDCDWLYCLEEAECCPVPIEYSLEDKTCTKGNWFDSFGTNAWNNCPDGYFVTGFVRGKGDAITRLEDGVCCKPPSAPGHWGECYIEDIANSFDLHWAKVGCHKPQYYIVAIETHACDQISCIEKLKCCNIANA